MICGGHLTKSWLKIFQCSIPENIPHQVRQLVTIAALTVLERSEELKLHLHAALNVGCRPQEISEVIFQMTTYGGVPVVNSALKVFRSVLQERGLWPLKSGE
ncbi:MAG: carboxymuconolactone decarboxylase family protein [bacterium]